MKDLILSIKMAAKDRVDVGMFLIAVLLSILEFAGHKAFGSVIFLTFYIAVLLVRFGLAKRMIEDKPKPEV